ncbi:diaminopropionate ammonia-lyase [Heliobacterium gestii]|uniref:Diaminopropionate ammonia-lyase n=1 Tax=Heliomicrobium gestii TaxID=2699 RepID=A0A845LFV3_HELGE|nr:diaminopropionate ammonia-lyase [Heliomicrobium gestii]MBM7866950.1 diaminopropionate ammonia-lyase [Heliomicrobium gestii]MZP42373.1 diaminopropionate ammonia-lyase [Heliomicrobium gestii]
MSGKILWTGNTMQKQGSPGLSTAFLGKREIEKARRFHQSFPEYKPTPLQRLTDLAGRLGVAGIYVKDESYRFGLNAFKVLGGSYAIARHLAQRLGRDIDGLPYRALVSHEVREQLGQITFATTTDGNHGRGVAWTAKRLGQQSVVYMPKGSSLTRLEKIRVEGANACITEYNYDDAVRMTAEQARKYGWVVLQDTAWEGYEEIPTWIMQGYGTMAIEAQEQLQALGVEKPTHIFIQAGVGSLAGAISGFFTDTFGDGRPKLAVVEPDQADCFFRSALAGDGKPRSVGGDLATIMAGLACGEPNRIGWEILRDYSDMFFSCPDWVAAVGMRVLGNPLGEDRRVISGESGAVTLGLLDMLLTDPKLEEARIALNLTADSQVLLFSTEGNTDPDKYLSIVWDGECPGDGKE